MKEIQIMLVDDQSIVRDGIKALLINESTFNIIGEASDGKELIEKLAFLKPDVMIVDNFMPRMLGTDLIKILKDSHPEIKIIFYSAYLTKESISTAIKAGAKAVIHKHSIKEELIDAINTVYAGEKYYSEFLLY